MAIPGFQSLMLPMLREVSDGGEHTEREMRDVLADSLNLTAEERTELLPTGRQRRFDDRVHWARVHLTMAVLLENTEPRRFRITERGLEVLNGNHDQINIRFLRRYAEYLQRTRPPGAADTPEPGGVQQELDQTPEELLESSYQTLRRSLAEELLERVKKCSPGFFSKASSLTSWCQWATGVRGEMRRQLDGAATVESTG